jgi:2-polyprenyl-3-methyl-5-hydroxy-6-metoxy-1,4-benzoquinol methylase
MRTLSMLNRFRQLVLRQGWENYSAQEWNRQYSSSTWRYLAGLEQAPRYAIIEAWRHRLKPSGSVLDLGCGEGVLFEQIPPAAKVNYTGVDLAQVAIDAAANKIRDASLERFVCADLVTFDPPVGSAFDVIVFNEVLYYVADPPAAVHRYRNALAPDGLIIVSIFHRNVKTWKVIDEALASKRLQTTFVRDLSSGKGWYLGLYQDKR